MCNSIFLFLGFLHHFVKIQALNLHAYTCALDFAKCISYQVDKAMSIVSLGQHISHAKKVLQFLRLTARGHEVKQIDKVSDWMNRLKSQLVSNIPKKRKDPVQLEEVGEWLPSPDVVAMLENLRQTALQGVPPMPEEVCTQSIARLLHDACLSSCMFGYLPPLRLACLRTLQLPAVEACLDVECRLNDCKGNRMFAKEDGYWISLPHHKNQRRWRSNALEIKLPDELAHLKLVSIYIERAHDVLCPKVPYMFVDSKREAMVHASTLSTYWLGLLKRLGSPAAFPPNMLRHIFVDERRSEDCAPGPSNLGAAQVLGNSVPQWDKAYDLNQNRR